MPITLDTIAIPSPDVLFQNLSGESVLLNLASESYFGLNPVGTRVWELLQSGKSLPDIVGCLIGAYDVSAEQAKADVLGLLAELEKAGLVKLEGEAAE